MKSLTDTQRLSNGVEIPCVGFGTWKVPDGEVAYHAVLDALRDGYRHIDTASYYANEASVGRAIRGSGLMREEVFVTSKLWNDDQGYDPALRAFERTLEALALDSLDLYLVHWPRPAAFRNEWPRRMLDTWRAFERLYAEGRVRAIGVSNFQPHHLEEIKSEIDIQPMVNQIEIHPGYPQRATVEYCRRRGMVVEAWGPLGRGALMDNELLRELARKYNRTVAQICLRWELQRNIVPLPKSVTPSRIAENARLFDFVLNSEDMEAITEMPTTAWSGLDPDRAAF